MTLKIITLLLAVCVSLPGATVQVGLEDVFGELSDKDFNDRLAKIAAGTISWTDHGPITPSYPEGYAETPFEPARLFSNLFVTGPVTLSLDGGETVYTNRLFYKFSGISNPWTELTGESTFDAGAGKYLTFAMYVENTGNLWFSNKLLNIDGNFHAAIKTLDSGPPGMHTPEPASAGLMMIAGLALVLSKRFIQRTGCLKAR